MTSPYVITNLLSSICKSTETLKLYSFLVVRDESFSVNSGSKICSFSSSNVINESYVGDSFKTTSTSPDTVGSCKYSEVCGSLQCKKSVFKLFLS
jgi:hypothetical protein